MMKYLQSLCRLDEMWENRGLWKRLKRPSFTKEVQLVIRSNDYGLICSTMEKRKFRIDFNGDTDHSIQYLRGLITDTRTVTLQIVNKLMDEEIDWQYQPGWNTIGALLAHIVAVQQFFLVEYVEERKLTDEEHEQLLPALDMGVHLPKLIGVRSKADYHQSLVASNQLFLSRLDEVSFADFVKTRADYDEIDGCNLAWVLYHMVEDEIYHRGQISLIRKLFKVQQGNNQ